MNQILFDAVNNWLNFLQGMVDDDFQSYLSPKAWKRILKIVGRDLEGDTPEQTLGAKSKKVVELLCRKGKCPSLLHLFLVQFYQGTLPLKISKQLSDIIGANVLKQKNSTYTITFLLPKPYPTLRIYFANQMTKKPLFPNFSVISADYLDSKFIYLSAIADNFFCPC